MTDKSQIFEAEIVVRDAKGQEARVSREYSTSLPMSAEDAAKQLYDSLPTIEKSRMRNVADGD